jgi:hypothetical protein
MIFAAGAVQYRASQLAVAQAAAMHTQISWRAQITPTLVLAALVPAVMIGFRYQVGGDWEPYQIIFSDIADLNLWDAMIYSDPGYALINWIATRMGVEIWGVNIICGIIFTAGLVRFAANQPNPWLAVCVAIPYLVIGVAMGYSRQAVAIGCIMIGLVSISRGSFPRFILWSVVAALFHRSALVLVPIVAISYSRSRVQSFLFGGVATIVGYFVLIAPMAEHYAAGYLEQVYEAQGAGVRLAMNAVPAVIFLSSQARFRTEGAERTTWRNLSLLALATGVGYFLISSTVILDRLGLYVIPLQVFVLSRVPSAFGRGGVASGGLTMVVLIYSALVQFVWLNFANHAQYWLPYRFYPLFW